jgi:hypothetical protein
MPKTHHDQMEHKLNSKEKRNLGQITSLSNPSIKSNAFNEKSMAEPYHSLSLKEDSSSNF